MENCKDNIPQGGDLSDCVVKFLLPHPGPEKYTIFSFANWRSKQTTQVRNLWLTIMTKYVKDYFDESDDMFSAFKKPVLHAVLLAMSKVMMHDFDGLTSYMMRVVDPTGKNILSPLLSHLSGVHSGPTVMGVDYKKMTEENVMMMVSYSLAPIAFGNPDVPYPTSEALRANAKMKENIARAGYFNGCLQAGIYSLAKDRTKPHDNTLFNTLLDMAVNAIPIADTIKGVAKVFWESVKIAAKGIIGKAWTNGQDNANSAIAKQAVKQMSTFKDLVYKVIGFSEIPDDIFADITSILYPSWHEVTVNVMMDNI